MATTASTLVNRVRRFVRDWPLLDTTTAVMSTATSGLADSVVVADNTSYTAGNYLEIDQEVMYVTGLTGGTTINVRRGIWGSTAASHASGATILVNPRFFFTDILDALNAGLAAVFPKIYVDVTDESLTTTASGFEYTVPNVSGLGTPIPYLYEVSIKESGDLTYRRMRSWTVVKGATPKLHFPREPVAGSTLRLRGIAPHTPLTALTDTLNANFPAQGEDCLKIYASITLGSSGTRWRTRLDSGAVDTREQANTIQGLVAVETLELKRFYAMLAEAAMAPPSKHLRRVY